MVKNPPAKQDTRVQSLGWGDPPEKEMANHSIIFTLEISQTEEAGGLPSMESQSVRHNLVTKEAAAAFKQIFDLQIIPRRGFLKES